MYLGPQLASTPHPKPRIGFIMCTEDAGLGVPPWCVQKFVSARSLLGGSWVVIRRVISPLIWVIRTVTLLITPHL